ncbi:glycosyltransferase [Staphylotrichum tortipilum]|uniref:Glycosyltransferase n=1 Tax=Staphylotrichum tortipilum TaxID=2831512 RepID=A0AAN6MNP9_9PEZI|nr:glycosyltransferase [Staphylotrichum longicolle]
MAATDKLSVLLNLVVMASVLVYFDKVFVLITARDTHLYWFLVLFAWRYLRLVVNLVAFWHYKPSPKPNKPTYFATKDVTAVIPTVDPARGWFHETLESCAQQGPAKIIVITAGDELFDQTIPFIREAEKKYPNIEFVVDRTQVANKREQVALAVEDIDTAITVLLDDHVFWGPRFLETVLRAFEAPDVGLVGTNKRVRRHDGLGLWARIWNMLGATYLCRHNFEIRATNTVDGGVFVVSGRTCAIRTEILQHPDFLPGYTNERFFFGLFGPLNPDDDNYCTRFVVRNGWKIRIEYSEDSVMETVLGVESPLYTKFLGQCQRWVRTTWRSNICSLVTDRTVWASQPYCVYAVYLTSLTNFAAVTDSLLLYLFARSPACVSPAALAALVGWMLLTKTVKVFDYFRRHPRDIPLFPFYVLFAYFHSFIKLWALFTFWDCTWSGRALDKIKVDPSEDGRSRRSSASTTRGSHNNNSKRRSPNPSSSSYNHPHLSALHAIHARISALHAQHDRHIGAYQQPVLEQLKALNEDLVRLRAGQGAIGENQEAIRAEMEQVVALVGEVTGAMAGEGDIAEGMSRLDGAVAAVEEKCKAWSSRAVEGVQLPRTPPPSPPRDGEPQAGKARVSV